MVDVARIVDDERLAGAAEEALAGEAAAAAGSARSVGVVRRALVREEPEQGHVDGRVREPRGPPRERRRREDDGPGAEERAVVVGGGRGHIGEGREQAKVVHDDRRGCGRAEAAAAQVAREECKVVAPARGVPKRVARAHVRRSLHAAERSERRS